MTDFSDFNATYTTMTMAGVKTNVQSGELELDGEMFRKALGGNFDEVVRLFTREGYASTTNVTMGRTTSDTTSGIYDLEEVDAQYMRIRLQGSSLWSQSDARNGDIVTFSEGAAKGLSLTAPFGALGGASATFTHSKGLGVLLDELAEKFTDPTDGVITMRQDSMRKGIEDADERIERVEARVESYRLRLVSQFSDMERTMNNLKTQSSNMLNALGT
jgi:flagellar capping protein FliD